MIKNTLDQQVMDFYSSQGSAESADAFSQALLKVHPGDWRATFPPAVFPPGHLTSIGADAARLLAIVFSLPERLFGGDYSRFLAAQCLTPQQHEDILAFCTPHVLARARLFARPDALLTHEGFKLVEMNVTPSLGGLGICDRYVTTLQDHALSHRLQAAGITLHAPDMGCLWAETLHRHRTPLADERTPVMLELLDDPDEIPEDNFGWPDFGHIARRGGFRLLTGKPADVRFTPTGVYAFGVKIDIVFTDLVYAEQLQYNIDNAFIAALVAAENQGQIDLFSVPASCAVYDNKANLALLTDPDYAHLFTEQERALIDAHIPPTFILTPGNLARAIREQSNLVLKPGLGLCGYQVMFGRQMSAPQWRAQLERQLTEGGSFVLQDIVDDIWTYTLPHQQNNPRMVCIGPIVIDGRYTGTFSRDEAYHGKAIVVNHAQGASWSTGLERAE
ncbi:hypothetical protein [Serratia plymuthica]|uniref:hypothetical protein n=1 Tax=Serratia plymuthica TaxID=82996 RepID=UPI0005630E31|nr:hypothetical protein [Serratia plymuthica]